MLVIALGGALLIALVLMVLAPILPSTVIGGGAVIFALLMSWALVQLLFSWDDPAGSQTPPPRPVGRHGKP